MTNQQINERIAKLCGWTVMEPSGLFKTLYQSPTGRVETEPPQYTDSLDSCREFESAFNTSTAEQYVYEDFLIELISLYDDFYEGITIREACKLIYATPLQRCEAFLRMKGQWE